MKKNQGQKTSKSLKTNNLPTHEEQFGNVMFEHITGKGICLKCNAVDGNCSHRG